MIRVMNRLRNRKLVAIVLLLATLGARAATPDGFMPSAPGNGLLFELCPSAVPARVMQVIRSWQHGDHHMHHGRHGAHGGKHGAHDSKQCPIGHLLASAAAVDTTWAAEEVPSKPVYVPAPVVIRLTSPRTAYSSRDPPSL